ncbi:hypothetical protein ADK67_46045 [Saccharothrix sp. NRRL B-16348]|nr:hypothetical protein ADK67_46045 [Saccharothrix sp. NRRL B-16348]
MASASRSQPVVEADGARTGRSRSGVPISEASPGLFRSIRAHTSSTVSRPRTWPLSDSASLSRSSTARPSRAAATAAGRSPHRRCWPAADARSRPRCSSVVSWSSSGSAW